MFKLFLLCHIIGVTIWVGGGLYEKLFIVQNLKKAKGTPREVDFAKLIITTAPWFQLGILLLLIGGIGMTVYGKMGFYHLNWLGVKQMIMTAIILIVAFFGRSSAQLAKSIKSVDTLPTGLPEDVRAHAYRALKTMNIVHVGVLINFVLGILKPF